MGLDSSVAWPPRLLRDQVQLIKRKDSGRYEIVPNENPLSFGKGVYAVIRACQLLAQKKDGLILVGLAGPSGAGKTFLAEKVLNFMPTIAIIDMASYRNGNFDDWNTFYANIDGLKEGKPVQVPIYDVKSGSRIGYRTLEVPSSRIVILEGIYALSVKLRPLLDLRVSVTGGLHFDLVKRVLRDIHCDGQEPEEIIHQITETVYPLYKASIEPNLKIAHIKILNKFSPFTCIQNPTYILKSTKAVTPEQMKAPLSANFKERTEETYDIYLLPPGKDPETCQSYLRMRNQDGKYILMFEEWVTDRPFIISPRVTFEVILHVLGGLIALGYTIAAILKRQSHIFDDDKVIVKTDWLEQLNRTYVQVQGKDRSFVKNVADQLGLEGSYVPHTYIEQIQLERLVGDVLALPDDLKTMLSLNDDTVSKEALSRYMGVITQLSDQISTLNVKMDEFTSRLKELNTKIPNRIADAGSQHNLALSSEQVLLFARGKRQIMQQMDTLNNLLRENVGERSCLERLNPQNLEFSTVHVHLCLAICCLGIFAYSRLN